MSLNSDKDVIEFQGNTTTLNDDTKSYCPHAECPKVVIGSEFCRNCSMCYAYKIRFWNNDSHHLEFNGYLKCAANHPTKVKKVKSFIYHLLNKKPNVKILN